MLGGSTVSRPTLGRMTLAGPSLRRSPVRRSRLGRARLRCPDVRLLEAGCRAPRAGVATTVCVGPARSSGIGTPTTEATAKDRLRADVAVRFEAGDDLLRDRRAEDALDLAEELQLIDT